MDEAFNTEDFDAEILNKLIDKKKSRLCLKQSLLKLKNLDVNELFDDEYLFKINYLDTELFLSISLGDEKNFGVDIYLTDEQSIYLRDTFDSEDYMIPPPGSESLYRIELIDAKDIEPYDRLYLHEFLGNNISKTNNLLGYTIRPGYDKYYIDNVTFDYLAYVLKRFSNELEKNLSLYYDRYKENLYPVMNFDSKKTITLFYDDVYVPKFEYKKFKYHKGIVNDLKDKEKIDDTLYIISRFMPIPDERGLKPLLIFFIYENGKRSITKYINNDRHKYKEIFFGMLYDVLSENGVPKKVIFDFRDFYYIASRTLEVLNVDVVLNTKNDLATKNFEEALEEISNMTNGEEELDDVSYFNLFVEGASILVGKLIEEYSIDENEMDLEIDDNDEEIEEELDNKIPQ